MTLVMAGALALSMSGAVGAAEPVGEHVIKACVMKSTKVDAAEHLRQPDLVQAHRGLSLLERHRSEGCHRRDRRTGPPAPRATGNTGATGPTAAKGNTGTRAPQALPAPPVRRVPLGLLVLPAPLVLPDLPVLPVLWA